MPGKMIPVKGRTISNQGSSKKKKRSTLSKSSLEFLRTQRPLTKPGAKDLGRISIMTSPRTLGRTKKSPVRRAIGGGR